LSGVKNCCPRLSIDVSEDEKENNKNNDENGKAKYSKQRIDQVKN